MPFTLEDGGRLGAHAQALLRSFVARAKEKGRRPPLAYKDSSSSAPTYPNLSVAFEMAAPLVHLDAPCPLQASPSYLVS